jgi:ElaB/YqjD/DUF883 family membrane-anchored ribosome-binding protein
MVDLRSIEMNLNNAGNAAAGVADRVQGTAGAMADEVQTQAEKFARQASATARDAYGKASIEVGEVAKAVRGTVHDQPLVALLAVGAIGGLLGAFLARR